MAPRQALICGSLAYDTIMVFEDRFKNHILADKVHMLSVAFYVPKLRREFGGCAGNIAYNLKLLGGHPVPFGAVGRDFEPYRSHFEALDIDLRCVRELPDHFTAQAYITTDLDDNQITAFHPGAMMHSQLNQVADIPGASLGIVSPDGPEGMLAHVEGFAAGGVPFVFDPGQALPILSGEQLLRCLKLARYCTVNDYEARLMSEKTGRSIAEMAAEVKALVVTLGGDGSQIYVDGECIQIPAVKADAIADPTGCGDAYRAGLLYGLAQGWDWTRTGRLAAVMGAIKIASRGPQNHRPSREDIAERYRSAFGELPW